jgi:hypothetical protein
MLVSRDSRMTRVSSARVDPAHVRCAIGSTPRARISRDTSSDDFRDDPLAPYVTETKSGPAAASWSRVSPSTACASGVRGGYNSNDNVARALPFGYQSRWGGCRLGYRSGALNPRLHSTITTRPRPS